MPSGPGLPVLCERGLHEGSGRGLARPPLLAGSGNLNPGDEESYYFCSSEKAFFHCVSYTKSIWLTTLTPVV